MRNREAPPTLNLRPFSDHAPAFCPDPWRILPPQPPPPIEHAEVQVVSSPTRQGEDHTVVFVLPAART
jgi:hypothetical protein